MYTDKFRKEDGSYKAESGCEYDSAKDLIEINLLGFCGCGSPSASLEYVRDCLIHIKRLQDEVWENKITFAQWKEDGKKLFVNEGAEYFMYYFLADKDLTEHGSSVPGWLSPLGLELLEEILTYDLDT